jgi:NAD-dependent dihydropyrimidine dehydrogenase PreA subunit
MSDDCKAAPGEWRPVIDRARCEGKAACVPACPYDVFEVRTIDEADRQKLSFLARLKLRVHGNRTAYTPRADACRACGLCIAACPEDAISLVRTAPPA